MAQNTLTITSASIKNELSKYEDKPYDALCEYIWNSFDAGATEVKIDFDLPDTELGYIENLVILDNGIGWDFEKQSTNTFLSSDKLSKHKSGKSLPKGKLGRGRYVFVWFCKNLEVSSLNKTLTLDSESLELPIKLNESNINGTKVSLVSLEEKMSSALINLEMLKNELTLEFCWFLKENPSYKILIRGEELKIISNIKASRTFTSKDFSKDLQPFLDEDFNVTAVLWNKKPNSEFSKFYFLDSATNKEILTKNTSLNKQKDEYWHSAYITSSLFSENDNIFSEGDETSLFSEIGDQGTKEAKKLLIEEIRKKLIELRKPILTANSDRLIDTLKLNKSLPKLEDFGIYDEESYINLIKHIYVIAPELFTGKRAQEQAFICATFAGLLSSQDNSLIRIILDQLQVLTEDEKKDLEDLLQRTSLSNMVRTIKEIDQRLSVISDLDRLLFDYRKETLEVVHLQQVLNRNPWIFGEQYRLFCDTEGAIRNTLFKYATEILKIENPEIKTRSRKELDLFLVKSLPESEDKQTNIIVEIKRPSVTLGLNEYRQIEEYALTISEEPSCNGTNMFWEFYLIGDNYDQRILSKIEGQQNHGEKNKGLVLNQNNGRIKIYIRKWSEILHVELEHKMKYLKERLQISKSVADSKMDPQKIVDKYIPSKITDTVITPFSQTTHPILKV
jgi:hypothetical protein